MFVKFSIAVLIIALVPMQLFAAGLKRGEPVKIYIIDTGYNNGMGLPKDAVHLHDTGSFSNGIARGGETHGTDMTKIYYDKLKDKIESGEVELHSINATDKNGHFTNQQLIEAIKFAKDNGANIVNMSFGASRVNYMSKDFTNEINNLTKDGTIVVNAAGNEGDVMEGGKFFDNQANNFSLISVGALDPQYNNNKIQDYSSGQKTGMIDVYATSVTQYGGTSSATAYTGATIANEFLEGNISKRYDEDADGTIDVYEARSFISSPDIADKQNIIGADKAQYKALIKMGYRYDKENGNFYLPGKNGEKKNTITALVLHETEDDKMIEYKMNGFIKEKEREDQTATTSQELDRYNTYLKMGRNLAIFRNSSGVMSMDGYYSQALYNRGLDLSQNDWEYDDSSGKYVHYKKVGDNLWDKTGLSMTVDDAKNYDNASFNRMLRVGELLQVGYKFENNKIVDKNGKTYPVNYVDNILNYDKLLEDAGVDYKNSFWSTSSLDKAQLGIVDNQDNTNNNQIQINNTEIDNNLDNAAHEQASTVDNTNNNRNQNIIDAKFTQNNTNEISVKTDNKKYGLGSNKGLGGTLSIPDIIGNIIKIILDFVGGLSVLVIIIAGVMYIMSFGDYVKINNAKQWILYAIVGLVISLLGWVIVDAVIKGLG